VRRSIGTGIAAFLVGCLTARAGRAADPVRRPPMPEPILGESVTDIDGIEAGELEVSADAGRLRSRRQGSQLTLAGAEVEWLVTHRLGLRIEPQTVRTEGSGIGPHDDFDVAAAVCWKLVRDLTDDFYLQAEAGGQLPWQASAYPTPDQAGLPFVVDMRTGYRRGAWTMRGSVGAAAGGAAPHTPLRASAALLIGFDRQARTGFFGVEAIADGTWVSPFVVAPDVVADLAPVGLPVRIGVSLPWSPGAGDTQPSLGLYLRLIVEPLRDVWQERP
jgi:hypothetical protein